MNIVGWVLRAVVTNNAVGGEAGAVVKDTMGGIVNAIVVSNKHSGWGSGCCCNKQTQWVG